MRLWLRQKNHGAQKDSWCLDKSSPLLVHSVVLGWSLFIMASMIFFERPSDFFAHMQVAKDLGFAQGLTTYSIFYPLQHTFSFGSLTELSQKVSLIAIVVMSLMFRYLISVQWLKKSSYSYFLASIFSAGLLLSVPSLDPRAVLVFDDFFDLSRFEKVIIGQTTPNVWHNATSIFMAPFAILSTIQLVSMWKSPSRKNMWMVALSLFLATAAKPNFSMVLIPVGVLVSSLPLREFTDGFLSRFNRTLAVFVPSLLLLAMQYMWTFVTPVKGLDRVNYVILPFAQWVQFSDHIWISVFRSIEFPLIALFLIALLARTISLQLLMGWILYLGGVLVFILFHEVNADGSGRYHGNFAWQLVPITYLLFLFSLAEWGEVRQKHRNRWKLFWILDVLVFGVFALHAIVGLGYTFSIAVGLIPYG